MSPLRRQVSEQHGHAYRAINPRRVVPTWECCWVHCIDPRNSGDASDIAPEILEELVQFGSVEPEPDRGSVDNIKQSAMLRAESIFEIFVQLHEHGSTIVTSKSSIRGMDERDWQSTFGRRTT